MVDFDPDSEEKATSESLSSRRFGDFDCPSCNANNPHEDTFGDGDEVRCYYCGTEFEARVDDFGKLRLKEA